MALRCSRCGSLLVRNIRGRPAKYCSPCQEVKKEEFRARKKSKQQ